MRPLIALVLSAGILLGVSAYLRFADAVRQPFRSPLEMEAATGTFSADITLTFDAEADAFALDATSLIFKQQDRELLKREGLIPAGEPLVIEQLPHITTGLNAFYVEVIPKDEGRPLARAVRVRIFRDGIVVADETLWSEPGDVPRGEIRLDVPSPSKAEPHDHP